MAEKEKAGLGTQAGKSGVPAVAKQGVKAGGGSEVVTGSGEPTQARMDVEGGAGGAAGIREEIMNGVGSA